MRHDPTRVRNQARLQVLALLLLGALGLLSLDLAPVRAAVADYLAGMPTEQAAETRVAAGPMLEGRAPQVAATSAAGCDHAAPGQPTVVSEQVREFIEKLSSQSLQVTPSIVAEERARPTIDSVTEASRRLALSERQVKRLKRVVTDAHRDLADLRYVRNEAGSSWHQIVCAATPLDEMKDARSVMETVTRLKDFVDTPLASGDETFRQARDRILDGYRDHARRLLTPTQQERYDRHDVQGVFDASPFRSTLRSTVLQLGTLTAHAGAVSGGFLGRTRRRTS